MLCWKYKCITSWGMMPHGSSATFWKPLTNGIYCNQHESIIFSFLGGGGVKHPTANFLQTVFKPTDINKKSESRGVNERDTGYRPSPLRSNVRLCEFSGSVITMEYVPWSFSVGSITCESINRFIYLYFLCLNIWFKKDDFIYWGITII